MERIINDYLRISWSEIKPDKYYSEKFCDETNAIRRMYEYLYKNGILEKISFRFKLHHEDPQIDFAFDSKDLEPYREQMLNSGLKDADVAVRWILDEKNMPCKYSGAIQVSWPMMTYRDNSGCVGRSWEVAMVQELNMSEASEVAEVYREKGCRAAVEKLWDVYFV